MSIGIDLNYRPAGGRPQVRLQGFLAPLVFSSFARSRFSRAVLM
jgi:hypothetical protein